MRMMLPPLWMGIRAGSTLTRVLVQDAGTPILKPACPPRVSRRYEKRSLVLTLQLALQRLANHLPQRVHRHRADRSGHPLRGDHRH